MTSVLGMSPRPAGIHPVTTPITSRHVRALVLSRAGSASLSPQLRSTIENLAQVRYVVPRNAPTPRGAAALLADVQVLATTNATLPQFDSELLAACPDLRAVVLYATGYEHLDLHALADHGVTVSVLPSYATRAVAEHALAMIFSMSARVHLAHDRSRGAVAPQTSLRGVELGGRTLGIIGLGRIGGTLATMARGVGMRVVGCDLDPGAVAAGRGAGLTMLDHHDLLAASDVVAVCASTDPAVAPILDRQAIASLRPGSFVANVGRPCLVDTTAMVAAIRGGCVRGYAVDDVVLDPDIDGDLLAEGRVLQTGHSAWWRDEVLTRGAQMFGAALLAAVRGEPTDVVTPDAHLTRLAAVG